MQAKPLAANGSTLNRRAAQNKRRTPYRKKLSQKWPGKILAT